MNNFRRVLFGAAASLALLFAACSSSGGGDRAAVTPTMTPQPLPSQLQVVLDRVAELRGLSAPTNLRAEFVSRSDLPALLDSLITGDDRRWFEQTTRLYRLLGHLRNDQDYLSVYQAFGGGLVLGLYSPPDDTLWVVHNDGQQIDLDHLPADLEETLAHEFVHAVDDAHFDLTATDLRLEDNLDVSLAWTAVVEGNAVAHEDRYRDKYLALPGGRALLASVAQIGDVPPSIVRELYFPYQAGADWIRVEREANGTRRIDQWLADPPAGTAYILHPELLENGWAPEQVTLPDLAPALGDGWSRESGGTFGEFNLRNYLQLQAPASQSVIAAAGWAGDAYAVYANGDASVAAFRLHFASEGDAREFAEAHRAMLEGARATFADAGGVTYATHRDGDVVATLPPSGTDVLFVLATDRSLAERAISALQNG